MNILKSTFGGNNNYGHNHDRFFDDDRRDYSIRNKDATLNYISKNITQNLSHYEELTQTIFEFGGTANNDDHYLLMEESNSSLNYSYEPLNDENTLKEEINTKNKLSEFNKNFDLKPFNPCPYSLRIRNNRKSKKSALLYKFQKKNF